MQEDFEFWVDSLVQEGYDLSDYTWDEMADIYINEAREDEGLTPLQKIRKRNKRGNLVMQPGDQTRERRGYHEAGRGVKKVRMIIGHQVKINGHEKQKLKKDIVQVNMKNENHKT